MTLTLLPSAARIMVGWLKNHQELIPLHGGRVGTRLNDTLPAIRVQRIGGTPDDTWRDYPVMQVECWAKDETSADLLTRSVIAALPTVRSVDQTLGRVYTYQVDSGPFWAPDDPGLSTNVRYIMTVRMLITTP